MELTAEQISALAPDASSLAAGRKLGGPKDWRGTGRDAQSLWGECQGSALYQVKIDRGSFAYNCTCPSRKLPCKHVLGLLFLAGSGAHVTEGAAPEWVSSWLEKRTETAKKKEEKQQAAESKPVDTEAQAKRAAKRVANVNDGISQLDLWMADLVRGGLGALDRHNLTFWQDQAKRLVNAQARGLAGRVERLGEIVSSGPDWPERFLGELGRLSLLTEAYGRISSLDPRLAADVRQMIGWNVDELDSPSTLQAVYDRWLVLGQSVTDEERIRVERNWLLGLSTARTALVLQFAFGTQPFPQSIVPSTVIDGEISFYESAFPQRAQILKRSSDEPRYSGKLVGSSIAEMLTHAAEATACQPWIERTVGVIADARLAPVSSGPWQLCDADGFAVPVARSPRWTMLAMTGGVATTFAGLWNGVAFEPLGAVIDDVYVAISERAS